MLQSLADQLTSELETLASRGRLRSCPELHGASRVEVTMGGRHLVSFCSNDYLGLASHPELAAAASSAASTSGFGAGASRLVSGNLAGHRNLEVALAALVGLPDALVFPSGYQANVGVLTALAGPSDLIVADRAVHASIIDGCRLSRAKLALFPHLQIDKAEQHLARLGPKARRRFLVTESLFSMDGDCPPLPPLRELADAYDAALLVDEAHAIGILGPLGAGLCARDSVIPDVLVGTLGKALGAAGAFVAGSTLLTKYLTNRARPFIFSTALPPPVAAAALRAVAIVRSPEGEDLRHRLAANVSAFRSAAGFPPDPLPSPILPILLGADETAVLAAQHFQRLGFFIRPIRPPAVRDGTSRLRITFSSRHSPEQLSRLAEAVVRLRSEPVADASSKPHSADRRAPPSAPPLPPFRGLFIAGTDTAAGKTTIGLALLALFARHGISVVPFKPVETGALPFPRDATALRAASAVPNLPIDLVCPLPFPHPIAPAAAAALQKVTITLPVLLHHLAAIRAVGLPLLVESAGGLLSPYATGLTSADLAAAFQLPLLLVAPNSLGTVSHTALATAEIRRRGLPFIGTVLVDTAAPAAPDHPFNANLIADLTGVAPLGTLPFVNSPSPADLATALEAAIDLRPLWDAVST